MLARPLPFDRRTKTTQWREDVSAGGGETTGKPHTHPKKQLDSQMRSKFGAARGAGQGAGVTDGTAQGPAASARPCFLRWAPGRGVLRQQERGAPKRRALGVQPRTHTEQAAVGAAGVAAGEGSALRAGPGLQRFQGHETLPKFKRFGKIMRQ